MCTLCAPIPWYSARRSFTEIVGSLGLLQPPPAVLSSPSAQFQWWVSSHVPPLRCSISIKTPFLFGLVDPRIASAGEGAVSLCAVSLSSPTDPARASSPSAAISRASASCSTSSCSKSSAKFGRDECEVFFPPGPRPRLAPGKGERFGFGVIPLCLRSCSSTLSISTSSSSSALAPGSGCSAVTCGKIEMVSKWPSIRLSRSCALGAPSMCETKRESTRIAANACAILTASFDSSEGASTRKT